MKTTRIIHCFGRNAPIQLLEGAGDSLTKKLFFSTGHQNAEGTLFLMSLFMPFYYKPITLYMRAFAAKMDDAQKRGCKT